MDMDTLGYFLFMEEEERKRKQQLEEVNVEIKNNSTGVDTTTNQSTR